VELKRNIKDEWWRSMVHAREDVVGIDTAIIMHPRVWEASGHVGGFNDMLVESRTSGRRYRADHLIEEATGRDAEGKSPEELTRIIEEDDRVKDPVDGGRDFAPVRPFNLMFETYMGPVKSEENLAYLRPETAQGIFVNFKNVTQTSRVKVPFGIAQQGKSFRNEITPGNLSSAPASSSRWRWSSSSSRARTRSGTSTGSSSAGTGTSTSASGRRTSAATSTPRRSSPTTPSARWTSSTISRSAAGRSWRVWRTAPTSTSGSTRSSPARTSKYFDQATNDRYYPYVIEPAAGPDRIMLAVLVDAYNEEEVNGEQRTVLKLHPRLAPVKAAVFPLSKKEPVSTVARELYDEIKGDYRVFYDESGAIGRRYRRQDEAGTPFCVTVDFDTLDDKQVTIRDRDSMEQERVPMSEVRERLQKAHLGVSLAGRGDRDRPRLRDVRDLKTSEDFYDRRHVCPGLSANGRRP
jgi:glycyl-tRNA synthetase